MPVSPQWPSVPDRTTSGSIPRPSSRTSIRRSLDEYVKLDLDVPAAGMAKGVDQGFAADPVHLVADHRVQRPGLAFDDDAIVGVGVLPGRELLVNSREGLLEIVRGAARRSQPADGVAPLLDDPSHQVEHPVDGRPGGRIGRQAIRRHVELHRRADETLQQRVVQLLRDACPLGQPLFEPDVELSRHAEDAQAVEGARRRSRRGAPRSPEPGRLPDARQDVETDRCFVAVPHAVAVRRGDAEDDTGREPDSCRRLAAPRRARSNPRRSRRGGT